MFIQHKRWVCCLPASSFLLRAFNHWQQTRSLFLQLSWLSITVLWETSMALIRAIYAEDTGRISWSRGEKMKDSEVEVSLDLWWTACIMRVGFYFSRKWVLILKLLSFQLIQPFLSLCDPLSNPFKNLWNDQSTGSKRLFLAIFVRYPGHITY